MTHLQDVVPNEPPSPLLLMPFLYLLQYLKYGNTQYFTSKETAKGVPDDKKSYQVCAPLLFCLIFHIVQQLSAVIYN